MRILLTNDDGIFAPGILALKNAAVKRGHECYVSAPAQQCSANAQHITLFTPLLTKRWRAFEDAEAYAVQGTPCDCVRIHRPLFDGKTMDVCLSGINCGENAGGGIWYSGTVCAAREAAMMGLKAIAVSIGYEAKEEALNAAAEQAILWAEKTADLDFPRGGVINLNFPAIPSESWGEMKLAPQSLAFFADRYQQREMPGSGEKYFWLDPGDTMEKPEAGSELYWLKKGHPTCTFLSGLSNENTLLEALIDEMKMGTGL